MKRRSVIPCLFALAVLASSLLSGCATILQITQYKADLPKLLKDDHFAITIHADPPPMSGADATNYYMDVTVENVSASVQVFDTSDLELKDIGTGVSYFSISKSKETVSLPSSRANTITKVELQPGQKTEGELWFVVSKGKAKAGKLELRMGQAVVMLEK